MTELPSLLRADYDKLLETHQSDCAQHVEEQARKEASRIRGAYNQSQRPAEAHTQRPVESHINALDLAHPGNALSPQVSKEMTLLQIGLTATP